MKVYIERQNKHIELEEQDGVTGLQVLKKLGINPAEILLIRNEEVILPEMSLVNSDEIQVLSVISGG